MIPLADGDPQIGVDYFVGIAAGAGTHTASASGYVDVYLDLPGTVYSARATTASTWDTQREVDLNTGYRISLDLISSAYTANVADDLGTSAIDGLQIVGGNFSGYEVYFQSLDGASWRGAGLGAA